MRLTLVTGAGCAALLLLGGVAPPARGDLRLEAPPPGFDRTHRLGEWVPVPVRLSGTAPPSTRTELQVRVSSLAITSTSVQSLRVAPGPVDLRFSVPVLMPAWSGQIRVAAQVHVDGRPAAGVQADAGRELAPAQPAIVALTQDRGGLGYLHNVELGIVHQPAVGPGPYAGSSSQPGPAVVLYPRPEDLPESPRAYQMADIVFLGDLPLDALTDGQWEAVLAWVRSGGHLVVSGGPDLTRLQSTRLRGILPLEPRGVRSLPSLPALAARYGAPPVRGPVPVATGPLRAQAGAFIRQNGVILAAQQRLGVGWVTFTAFDLAAPELQAWAGQTALWRDLAARGVRELRAADIVAAAAGSASWRGMGGGLADALAGVQAGDAPSFTAIGLFLAAYIVLLVPANYLLLRRWDRRELAWITAPLIIALFTTGAYAVGYSVKGGQLFLRHATVMEGAANVDGFDCHTLATIFSPVQRRYTLSVGDRLAGAEEATFAPLHGFQGAERSSLTIERTQRTYVRDALVSMWDHRSFVFDSRVEMGVVAASAVPVAGGLRVSVANHTGQALDDCVVSYRGQFQSLGRLGDGDSREARLQSGGEAPGRMGPVALQPSGPEKPASERIRAALASAIAANEAGVQGADPLVFSGWMAASPVDLRLEGERPTVQGATLVVVHIPTPSRTAALSVQRPTLPAGRADPFAANPGMGPQDLLNQATRLYSQGQHASAERLLRSSLAMDPSSAAARNMLAYALAGQGRLDEALEAAREAVRLSPRDGSILDTLAEMHQRRHEWQQAAEHYERALRLQGGGGIAETRVKLAETLLQLNRRDEAVRHLRIASGQEDPWAARARAHLGRLSAGQP